MHDKRHPQTPDALAHWLEAEANGRDDAAEAALAQVFRALPLPAPRPGFADRVLLAVAAPAVALPAVAARVFPLWLRVVVASSLALAGLGVAALPTVGVAVGRTLRPAELLTAAAGRLVAALDWITGGLATFEAFHGLREALLQALGAPPVVVALLLSVLISLLGFRGLAQLLTSERSLDHASTHG